MTIREDQTSTRRHLRSAGSDEVYFEVTRYTGLTASEEYRVHSGYLQGRFRKLAITTLEEEPIGAQPAWRYRFEWDGGARAVVLAERGPETYRIIYNPRSKLNEEILGTVRFIGTESIGK